MNRSDAPDPAFGVRHALENYIEEHKHDKVQDALDNVYTEESSSVDEALAEMQWASLPKEDW